MRVLVHDNLKTSHHSRTNYVSGEVTRALARLRSHVHSVDVTLAKEGNNSAAKTHCHATAHLGSLGVVTVDSCHANEHQAVRGVLARLLRGISRRVDIQKKKRKSPTLAAAN